MLMRERVFCTVQKLPKFLTQWKQSTARFNITDPRQKRCMVLGSKLRVYPLLFQYILKTGHCMNGTTCKLSPHHQVTTFIQISLHNLVWSRLFLNLKSQKNYGPVLVSNRLPVWERSGRGRSCKLHVNRTVRWTRHLTFHSLRCRSGCEKSIAG